MNIQLTKDGKLKHFLTTEGLSKEILTEILDTAENFSSVANMPVKKIPLLRGKTIINLFFENSTRTRTTFDLAATRLSADVINMNISTSATSKGESLLDTLRNLEAMSCDMFVVRHADTGAAHFIASNVAPHISVLNAGDGQHAHPTQAMLDVFTLRQQKGAFEPLSVAIVGDIMHSRVARSNIHALKTLGVKDLRVVGPRTLMPKDIEDLGVEVCYDMKRGIADTDAIIMLRLQRERMQGELLPSESEYYSMFGLTEEKLKLAKPDVTVMHPGPINRGVEIESSVADGKHSVILQQVTNGLAIRMAVMSLTLGHQSEESA